MIKNVINNLVKEVRNYLYQSPEDDRFGYWSCIPDWGGYLSFLKQNGDFNSDTSFGGMWLEQCIPSSKWGLANDTWEYHINIFLMRYLDSSNIRIKIQEDLLNILELIEKHMTLLKKELHFDRSELSLMMKKAGIALTCGELKLCLLVDKK